MQKNIAGLLLFLMLGLLAVVQAICYFFPDISFEAIVFNLKFIKTLPKSNEVSEFLYKYSLPIMLYLLICVVVFRAFLTLKALYGINAILFFTAMGMLFCKFDVGNYIKRRHQTSSIYEENYYSFNKDATVFRRQDNVVVLFVESLENSYINTEIVSQNFLPQLTEIIGKEISVKEHYQVEGTGWSIAGFIALNCGIPLIMPIKGHIYGIDNPFLPNISCLTDIFAYRGYQQYFVIGSSAEFSGFKNFFQTHGSNQTQIIDENYFNKNEVGGWGIKDSVLFPKLKNIIKEAHRQDNPFFITAMTINTHFPPYLEESCEGNRDDFKDVLNCTDKQISSFIKWFQQSEMVQDTILLVVGDHLAMKNSLYHPYLKPHHSQRRIFNVLITPERRQIRQERQITTFDWFPTILEASGADLPQHRLGLGVSIFDENQKTIIEEYGAHSLDEEIKKINKMYDSFL